MTIQREKTQLRKYYRDKRHKLQDDEYREKSKQVCLHLLEWIKTQGITQVFTFIAFRKEIDLSFLFERLWGELSFALPVVEEKGQMRFYEWMKGDDLQVNRYGIKEPRAGEGKLLRADPSTLILVPALAMDTQGQRLGYGGGYYDRYLAKAPCGIAMGVVWSEAVVAEDLPSSSLDISLPYLCTENGVQTVTTRIAR